MMQNSTVRGFRKNIRHIERALNIQNNSHCYSGITLAQCHAILEIYQHDKINLTDLSEKLFLDKSTVSRTIEGLVNGGFVNRSVPKDNRRKVIITLTGKGEKLCEQINLDNDAYFEKILQAVPGHDLPVFLNSFEKIVMKMIECNSQEQDTY